MRFLVSPSQRLCTVPSVCWQYWCPGLSVPSPLASDLSSILPSSLFPPSLPLPSPALPTPYLSLHPSILPSAPQSLPLSFLPCLSLQLALYLMQIAMNIFASLCKLNPLRRNLFSISSLRVVFESRYAHFPPSITVSISSRLGPGEIPNESGSGHLPTFCTAIGFNLLKVPQLKVKFFPFSHPFFCLLRPNSSLLLTSSMLWSNACENIEEYYFKSVGVPVQLLPTVLGLKLAIDLDLGSKYVSLKQDNLLAF